MKTTDYKVQANGRDITDILRDRLERLVITDRAGLTADSVTLELDNRDDKLAFPDTGAELEVWLGDGDNKAYKGKYQVTELEIALEQDNLLIHATAAAFRDGIKAPRSRTWSMVRFGDLVSEIAGEYGLEPVIAPALASVMLTHVNQQAESDLNLLTRLANERDAVAKPVAGRLLVTPRGLGQTASGRAMPEFTLSDPAHSEGTLNIAERTAYRSVTARWFDEMAQCWQQEIAGSGEPAFSLRADFHTQNEAANAAQAKLDILKRGRRTLSLIRPLTPAITAESVVTVRRHKAPVNGRWIVCEAVHEILAGGVSTTCLQLHIAK